MKKQKPNNYFKTSLAADLPASLVVFFVAIPLCLGVALACDVPMMAGLIAGIVGGIVVGSLGGSELGVSGPAPGLVAVIITAMAVLGAYEALLLATVLAGIMQYVLGRIRAGILAYYIPGSVITGMLAAIGMIIILKQIPHAMGYDLIPEGEESFQSADGSNTLTALAQTFKLIQPGAVCITLLSLATLLIWNLKALKKWKFFRIVPGALIAILVGVGVQSFFQQFIPMWALSADHLVQLPTGGNLADFIVLPDFAQITNKDVWIYALMIAAVGSIESLIVAEAADKLDPQKRITPMNKELRAQGIGNIVSGMLGGLPITQVIVRASANAQSGAKTRGSAILHGVLILAAVLIFPSIMNLIPLASLAAILILIGYRLIRPAVFVKMFSKGWNQFLPFLVTLVAILLTDLLVGIGIGIGVAVFTILMTNYRIPFSYHFDHNDKRPHIRMTLSEIVTFLNKGEILSTLQLIPEGAVLEIDATRSKMIDPDVLEVLEDFTENAQYRDIRVEMIGFDLNTVKAFPARSLRRKLVSPLEGAITTD